MDQTTSRFGQQRENLLQRIFPEGMPSLWCPLITHYTDEGGIDRERMRAHLKHISPYVGGFLLPGSTGDGWELSEAQSKQLVEYAIAETAALGRKLLIGALGRETDTVIDSIAGSLALIRQLTGIEDAAAGIDGNPVCGFTVCAPSGEDLSQEQIRSGLRAVLDLGLPTSLYQLPQVTGNEISPQTISELAANYSNFFLFKDTSGTDRVSTSGFRDVVLLRGAEGDYAQHLAANGGHYDGFLLSTANGFARELAQVRSLIDQGSAAQAQALSERLSSAVNEIFGFAQTLPDGNAFANANKAVDHFNAFGPGASSVIAPMLRCGRRLPVRMLEFTGEVLKRHRLMPQRGYLQSTGAEQLKVA
ncbi:MAG: dihydrodipicolinate synthase family protein [Burkholderiales bacterium]|jgi:dihydrodipicolinate synthase/N-acetylneuraminate lyase